MYHQVHFLNRAVLPERRLFLGLPESLCFRARSSVDLPLPYSSLGHTGEQ